MGGGAEGTARGKRIALLLLVLMVTGPAAAGSEALLPSAEPQVSVVEGVPPLDVRRRPLCSARPLA